MQSLAGYFAKISVARSERAAQPAPASGGASLEAPLEAEK